MGNVTGRQDHRNSQGPAFPCLLVVSSLIWFVLAPQFPFPGLSFAQMKGAEKGSVSERKGTEKVTIHFVDVELSAVTKFISEITGKNFIFDERARGKISIIAPSKLSVDEAFSLFTSVLELKGFTIVPAGENTFKIIPSVEARQRGILLR